MQQNPRQYYHKNDGKNEIAAPLLSYVYLNCIILISNNVCFAQKFLCNFIHQKPRCALSQNVLKNCTYSALQQIVPAKFISTLSFKMSTLRKILYDSTQQTITRIWGKMEQQRPLLNYMHSNYIIVISSHIYVVHNSFVQF